jgi:hypothetical protein
VVAAAGEEGRLSRAKLHASPASGRERKWRCKASVAAPKRIHLAQKPGKIGHFSRPLIEYYRGACDAAWSIWMMSPAKTLIPATALALVAQLTVAIADGVPHYNLAPLCHGIAQQGGMSLLPNQSAPKDYKSCIRSEMVVRRQLVKLWPTFKTSNKANCFGENSAGGLPSYTGLLSCLQMAQDASKMFGK